MTAAETTVCVLTPPGRGAVAVVAVAGSGSESAVDRFFQAANGKHLPQQPLRRIVYGRWGSRDGEDLIVCRRSEHQLEIHCHGGQQSSARIVDDLVNGGCRVIAPDAWAQQEHKCSLRAAAQGALAQATTFRTAAILLDQYHGALANELKEIDAALRDGRVSDAHELIDRLLSFADLGLHLTKPWQVVIAGQPNVGKSSLINALVGYQRAIVFDQPGTTRDIVTASTAIDGWPVELSDTAGLHDTSDEIESAGIALARDRLQQADLVVWVLDATMFIAEQSTLQHAVLRQADEVGVSLADQRLVVVLNKSDLVATPNSPHAGAISTCALSGVGVESLLTRISNKLVPAVPSSGGCGPFRARAD